MRESEMHEDYRQPCSSKHDFKPPQGAAMLCLSQRSRGELIVILSGISRQK